MNTPYQDQNNELKNQNRMLERLIELMQKEADNESNL